ncbi:glycosyltransferase [Paraburkholderia caribensis]|uniref:glycosyltransferase n=1 Tax=Paraburkholderia caribensis TaxID=75105 RepID=UPI0009EF6C56|nr:glycosyltransferase [Paraburkholderia caribensis]
MKITVLVPTYRREKDLVRCLQALRMQERECDEVVVVARSDDEATLACLTMPAVVEGLPIKVALSRVPGVVGALNCGLDVATGDVIAITDDDAAPRPDWVRRIATAFNADPRLGGLGGRDWVHLKGRVLLGERHIVGKIALSGKLTGNHHLGAGEPREVDVLKGVNMSYRRDAIRNIRFDTRLRGSGAQVHNDMAFGMSVKNAGWKLIYDPQVAVDHFPAERFDEDRRDAPSMVAVCNAAFNLHLTLRDHLSPLHRGVAWWWYALIGTRVNPGAVHVLLSLLSGDRQVKIARWRAVRIGAREARREQSRRNGAPTTSLHA